MSTLDLTLTTSDCYYPQPDYESHCESVGFPPVLCSLFPDTFAPMWEEVIDQVNKRYFSNSEDFLYMSYISIPYVLRLIHPEDTSSPLPLDYNHASYKIRSYLYSLLNDPAKRSRVTTSLVLDLLHNPEDV